MVKFLIVLKKKTNIPCSADLVFRLSISIISTYVDFQ